MGLFDSVRAMLGGGGSGDDGLELDPALGDERAVRLRAELAQGRWRAAASALERTRDWNARQFYLEAITEWPGRPAWIDEWSATQPGSPITFLVRGVHSISWAWEARGGGLAESVNQRGAQLFFERLGEAESDLAAAASLDPEDPTPWAYLVRVGMGLQHDKRELRRRFEEAIRRCPDHRLAHAALLWALCEKWGGSHAQMFEHARRAAAAAPEGSGLPTLVVQAHIERWLYFHMDGDRSGAETYSRNQAAATEIAEAWTRSLGSTAHRETRQTASDRNFFAFGCRLFGLDDLARMEMEKIGPRVAEFPWALMGDALDEFRKARKELGG